MTFFQRIARAVVRAADDNIYFWTHKVVKVPPPTGAWLILFRLLFVAASLQGVVVVAGGFYELYQSDWLGQALRLLRVHHPAVICIPLVFVFFLLAAWLAQFKLRHKQGYGFCEFLCGFASIAGLLMIVIAFPHRLSDTEWLVGTAGSLYLAAEGLSLILEDLPQDSDESGLSSVTSTRLHSVARSST